MFKEIKFGLYSIKKNVQNSSELRMSFIASVLGMMINNSAFIFLWSFFIKAVGIVGGWTVADVICLQGFGALIFGLCLGFAKGLRNLPHYVHLGSLDRFILSPKNLLIRIGTSATGISELGDIIFGIICLIIYAFLIQANLIQISLMIFCILTASLTFLGVIIFISSVSFYFNDSQSIATGLFDLFFTPALFHGGAIQGLLRFTFTFIIPSLLISTLPVETIKNTDLNLLSLLVILSIFWFILSLIIFNLSIRKYESSNFMTFGQ
jgi:ABC-2 type transport system permease protein